MFLYYSTLAVIVGSLDLWRMLAGCSV